MSQHAKSAQTWTDWSMLLREKINISSKPEQVQILTITPSEEHVKNLKFLST